MVKLWAESLDEHRSLVRRRLIEAFLELVRERPIDGVTVSAVAERAGLARSAVYNHVDHVHDLALLHTEASTAAFLAELESAPRDDALAWLDRLVHVTFRTFADDPLGSLDLTPHLSPARQARLRTHLAPLVDHIRERVREGVDHGDLAGNPEDLATFVWASLSGYRPVVGSGRADVGATATTVARLLRQALTAD